MNPVRNKNLKSSGRPPVGVSNGMKLKSEIRNPKSETSFKSFHFVNFNFVSNFVLRASCLLVLIVPLTAFAQGFVPLAPIPNLTTGDVANSSNLALFFNNLYKYLNGLAAILAIIEIIWGGLLISTQDSVSKKTDGKQKIYNAIFGLILVLSPVLVFSIINPSILNLSIGLEKLDIPTTSSGPGGGGGGGTGTPPTTDPTSGCTVSGTSGILQFATCPSDTAATKWLQSCSTGLVSKDILTQSADKTASSVIATCQSNTPYVFVNTNTSSFLPKSISDLQPLAKTTSNPNNGSDVMNFLNICKSAASASNLGWITCMNGVNWISDSVPCSPMPKTKLPGNAAGGCYQKNLVCSGDSSLRFSCSGSPSWAPFQ